MDCNIMCELLGDANGYEVTNKMVAINRSWKVVKVALR